MMMRLVFLITPTDDLLRCLDIERGSGKSPTCETTAVITPELDYEQHFEAWKNSWRDKAKRYFIAEFSEVWRDDENPFGEVVRALDSADDPLREFDRFWKMQQGEDVIEIASDWRPS